MSATWRCGDCGTVYPKTVHRCSRPFDDYLALRGGSVESAIQRAVDKAIEPMVEQALRRLEPRPRFVWRNSRTTMVQVDPDFAVAA